jgi:hypothetical protein
MSMPTAPLPTILEMEANILSVYARATSTQIHEGREWYETARRLVTLIARESGYEEKRIAYCLAALSPRNPWQWNVADAYIYAMAARDGLPMPSATTFKRNQRIAWAALTSDEAPWKGAALKVRNFVEAVMGNMGAVVIDVWAARVATNGELNQARNVGQYRAMDIAYRSAAIRVGATPCGIQAATWIVAQHEGLGSGRKGRHDKTFKVGTPDIIRKAME